MYRVSHGERPAEREELGDLDQTKWPLGLDGKTPADPWTLQYLMPLEDTSGNIVVFATRSMGGRRAVADLCAAYGRRASKNKGCGQPIIKLASVDMPTKFGKKSRPLFEIVAWNEPEDGGGMAPVVADSEEELNDAIPF
jgi:hypothetical protein